jgi:beta-galactosidase/beta-glucuronidase
MWSIGNEAAYGNAHDAIYRRFKELDPSRPVHYESCGGAAATDVLCPMYPSVEKLKKMAGVCPHGSSHPHHPLVHSFFSHVRNIRGESWLVYN